MRRLFVLLPNVEHCRRAVKALRTLGIPVRRMHAFSSIAKQLKGLPRAGVWQQTELLHGLEWGFGLGAVAGFIGVWLAIKFSPAGLDIGHGALALGAGAGALFGALVSALMKCDEHNHELDEFKREIERGKILLMVDVPAHRLKDVRATLLQQIPEAKIKVAAAAH